MFEVKVDEYQNISGSFNSIVYTFLLTIKHYTVHHLPTDFNVKQRRYKVGTYIIRL